MSLGEMFGSKTKEQAKSSGGDVEYVNMKGPYVVYVEGAWDGFKRWPEDREKGKSRHIGLRLRVVEPILDTYSSLTEDDEELEERYSQVGHKSTVRLWVSENCIEPSFQLMVSIARGLDKNLHMPEDIQKKVVSGTNDDGDPIVDKQAMANDTPINPTHLVGRFFVAYLEHSGEDRMELNMFQSHGIDNEEAEEYADEIGVELADERHVLEGEDTASKKYIQRDKKRNNGSSGGGNASSNGQSREAEVEGGESDSKTPDDDLPF